MPHPTHPSLGRRGRDQITGFEGVITGFCQYLTGCNQLLLAPSVDGNGAHREPHWFDEQRVAVDPTWSIALDNGATPGPDKPAPIR